MAANDIKSLQEVVKVIKQEIVYVEKQIDKVISGVYVPGGSVLFKDLPSLTENHYGKVYDIKDAFTTTNDFMEGSGKKYGPGTNVVIIKDDNNNLKYDCLAGLVDTTDIYNQIDTKQSKTLSKTIMDSSLVEGALENIELDLGTISQSISAIGLSMQSMNTAINGKLDSDGKAADSAKADFATKAVKDGLDNTIANTYLKKSEAATVATSGSYADLSNKPTIPAAQVNSDWNANSGVAQILNKPTIENKIIKTVPIQPFFTWSDTGITSYMQNAVNNPKTAFQDLNENTLLEKIDIYVRITKNSMLYNAFGTCYRKIYTFYPYIVHSDTSDIILAGLYAISYYGSNPEMLIIDKYGHMQRYDFTNNTLTNIDNERIIMNLSNMSEQDIINIGLAQESLCLEFTIKQY